MKKMFVLDTNVLLHSAASIFSFDDNDVVIPMPVIEELDRFKSRNDELGRNARMVVRNLDNLRRKGKLGKGVPTKNGGNLFIIPAKKSPSETGLDPNVT
ncbi:MAG: PIN domain-containing protein, partial [Nitrospinota bacterium]